MFRQKNIKQEINSNCSVCCFQPHWRSSKHSFGIRFESKVTLQTVPLQYTSGPGDCETILNPEMFPRGFDIINYKLDRFGIPEIARVMRLDFEEVVD